MTREQLHKTTPSTDTPFIHEERRRSSRQQQQQQQQQQRRHEQKTRQLRQPRKRTTTTQEEQKTVHATKYHEPMQALSMSEEWRRCHVHEATIILKKRRLPTTKTYRQSSFNNNNYHRRMQQQEQELPKSMIGPDIAIQTWMLMKQGSAPESTPSSLSSQQQKEKNTASSSCEPMNTPHQEIAYLSFFVGCPLLSVKTLCGLYDEEADVANRMSIATSPKIQSLAYVINGIMEFISASIMNNHGDDSDQSEASDDTHKIVNDDDDDSGDDNYAQGTWKNHDPNFPYLSPSTISTLTLKAIHQLHNANKYDELFGNMQTQLLQRKCMKNYGVPYRVPFVNTSANSHDSLYCDEPPIQTIPLTQTKTNSIAQCKANFMSCSIDHRKCINMADYAKHIMFHEQNTNPIESYPVIEASAPFMLRDYIKYLIHAIHIDGRLELGLYGIGMTIYHDQQLMTQRKAYIEAITASSDNMHTMPAPQSKYGHVSKKFLTYLIEKKYSTKSAITLEEHHVNYINTHASHDVAFADDARLYHLTMCLIMKLMRNHPTFIEPSMTKTLFAVAFVSTIKHFCDVELDIKQYAARMGLEVVALNRLRYDFCVLLDFNFNVPLSEFRAMNQLHDEIHLMISDKNNRLACAVDAYSQKKQSIAMKQLHDDMKSIMTIGTNTPPSSLSSSSASLLSPVTSSTSHNHDNDDDDGEDGKNQWDSLIEEEEVMSPISWKQQQQSQVAKEVFHDIWRPNESDVFEKSLLARPERQVEGWCPMIRGPFSLTL